MTPPPDPVIFAHVHADPHHLFPPTPIDLADSTIVEGRCASGAGAAAERVRAVCRPHRRPIGGCAIMGSKARSVCEPTLAGFIHSLTAVFAEVKRVLKPDGILWLNIGDGYTSGNRGWRAPDKKNPNRAMNVRPDNPPGLKDKDLLGLPWRLALALQENGWFLRSDIIWHKPNAMPESVKDRPTRAHEYLFMLTKSEQYRYDHEAVKEQRRRWQQTESPHPFGASTLQTPAVRISPLSPRRWSNRAFLPPPTRRISSSIPFLVPGLSVSSRAAWSAVMSASELNSAYTAEAIRALERPLNISGRNGRRPVIETHDELAPTLPRNSRRTWRPRWTRFGAPLPSTGSIKYDQRSRSKDDRSRTPRVRATG